jgi:hypothetical protein
MHASGQGHGRTRLDTRGYSWAEIGARLGITRQAAQQRWAASFECLPVRDKLDTAAGAGCSSRRLLLHARKVVRVLPDGDLQNICRGP